MPAAIVAASGIAGVVLAQAGGSGDPSPLDFTTYGISGAVIAAILLGWLWPKKAVDRLIESEARAVARAESLESTLKDDVVPILRDVAKATGAGGPLEKIATKVDGLERAVDRLAVGGSSS